MFDPTDTLVALCTAPGAAARAVIRLSGPDAIAIALKLCDGFHNAAGVYDVSYAVAGVIFPGSVYVFRAPASYTGDDVAELHFPGNPVIVRWLTDACLGAGARQAEAGEFTARAFFAGKLTIDQAEGVAATIHAENAAELAAARQLLTGALARGLTPIVDDLAALLALVEAGIDFSDQDVTFIDASVLNAGIATVVERLAALQASAGRFEALRREPTVVLVGPPNAGKSTLLNALAGSQRAIISPAAGTTRDALTVRVRLARGSVQVTDVAGFQASVRGGSEVGNEIAAQMRATALRAVESADVVVHVVEQGRVGPPLPTARMADLRVATKSDLGAAVEPAAGPADCVVSAWTGSGLDTLRGLLDARVFGTPAPAGGVALNQRHRAALDACRAALARASAHHASEIVAADLRAALDALGSVSGSVSPDDVIGRIFAGFCIGK